MDGCASQPLLLMYGVIKVINLQEHPSNSALALSYQHWHSNMLKLGFLSVFRRFCETMFLYVIDALCFRFTVCIQYTKLYHDGIQTSKACTFEGTIHTKNYINFKKQ